MGVSKGEGGGRWSPPKGCKICSFLRGRSLSDLAVWGFPETFPENLPPQASLSPPQPLFLPSPLSQFFLPSNTSLQRSSSGLYQPLLPSYPPFSPPNPFLPQGPYRILSGHLRNPSIGSPKRPFLSLFRGFRLTLKKG